MTRHRKKSKVTIYLDPDVTTALADFAARRDRSQSMIAEAAIASFLSPDDAERREAIIAKRLDQIDRRMTRVERDVGIAVESLAVFIRFWVTTTPALPEPAAKAAKAKSAERYEAFITALGRRLAQGPKLRQEISEDVGGADRGEGRTDCCAGLSLSNRAVRSILRISATFFGLRDNDNTRWTSEQSTELLLQWGSLSG